MKNFDLCPFFSLVSLYHRITIQVQEKKKPNIPRILKFCDNFDELELVQILTDRRNYRIPQRFEH